MVGTAGIELACDPLINISNPLLDKTRFKQLLPTARNYTISDYSQKHDFERAAPPSSFFAPRIMPTKPIFNVTSNTNVRITLRATFNHVNIIHTLRLIFAGGHSRNRTCLRKQACDPLINISNPLLDKTRFKQLLPTARNYTISDYSQKHDFERATPSSSFFAPRIMPTKPIFNVTSNTNVRITLRATFNHVNIIHTLRLIFAGGHSRNRTCDLLLKRELLYRLSYVPMISARE